MFPRLQLVGRVVTRPKHRHTVRDLYPWELFLTIYSSWYSAHISFVYYSPAIYHPLTSFLPLLLILSLVCTPTYITSQYPTRYLYSFTLLMLRLWSCRRDNSNPWVLHNKLLCRCLNGLGSCPSTASAIVSSRPVLILYSKDELDLI